MGAALGPQSAPELPPQGEFGAPPPPEGQSYGPPEGQTYGGSPGAQPYGPPEGQSYGRPPEGQPYGAPEGSYGAPDGSYGSPEGQPYGPPEGQPYGQQQNWSAPQRPAQPPYQAADETQVLPPQPAGDADATQFIPPVPGEAPPPLDTPTTTLAPVKSAPLPPENRPESPAESTTQLRAVRPGHRGAHRQQAAAEETAVLPPTPPAPNAPVPASAANVPERPGSAPYAIRPGRPGDRPPPSEFDGLFRDGGGAQETQQLPQITQDFPQPQPSMPSGGGGGGGRRRMSRGMLIGIVVAGCGIAGLAAGAALSMGGDDDKKDNSTLSSSSPSAGEDEPSTSADPAEPQAKALDALLADSNNSRASVIKAVDNIKSCKDLATAASDLRTAAGQRNGLVTRLGKLSVDKLPDNARLTAALTKAWKSSARADNEYAAWADQVGGKRGCPKGKARRTPRVGAAERASGEATQAKKTASGLWNPIASQYGLTAHQATEL
ncbi:hypothetical protein SSPO_057030 [Streptomyces antimycoticus]|uniref:Uncharacterized protein n=1 Tax=Streptomyces antimycoticus TaxID=68175 RepID=A0A499ULY7_9ACTN|nr:hypothetical protein [Streptomyces antimycoticus]BBJ42985.1 hypothetical protein SSPO_057030 [Streptomyces antimycoticus]